MNYSHYAHHKISINKYKGLSFEELATEIFNNDKKYLNIISKSINSPKTTPDKKIELQNFLQYFYNHFEPNYIKPEITTLIQSHPFWTPPIINIPYNKIINNIIHLSDIHIRLYNRSKEYLNVFDKLYAIIDNLILNNPNQIIIITGDLLHSKNTLSPECILTTQNFIIKLASYATTLLIAGNHDALLTNNQREDSITAIFEKVNIPNFYYLKNSAVYSISNLAIAVNSIIDNKWIYSNSFQLPNISHKIALYHGPVGLCDTGVGYRLRGEKLVEDFDGFDFVLLGDIHKFQFLDPENKRIAYASSLIAQNFNEWNSPHGFLHWDLINHNHIYHPIENDCGFFVFNLNDNHIFIEEQPITEENIPEFLQKSSMNVKLNIHNCSTEFVSKINSIVKNSCEDVKIIHNYLGNKIKESQPEINFNTSQLLEQYLKKTFKNLSTNEIQFIIDKYQEFSQEIEINQEQNFARWELIDIEFSNIFSYGPNNYIDFSKFKSDNPIGIIAPNSHGKSSLIDIILLTLFTKFSRTRGTGISKDIININANSFNSKLRFKIGSDIYVIIKEGKRELSEKVKITKNEFYKQNDSLILLTDEDRKKTDKIISELIGTYDDFIFTNVQLQNRNNSFKEMTDKERKEYLYKVLKLNLWNDVAKKISDSIKPLKNSINYLEKNIENKTLEEILEKEQEILIEIEITQDKIIQQLYEKEINKEIIENERIKLIPNLNEKYSENEIENNLNNSIVSLKNTSEQIKNLKKSINQLSKNNFQFITQKDTIISQFNKEEEEINQKIKKLELKLSNYKLQALIPTSNLWNKISFKEKNTNSILHNLENKYNLLKNNQFSNQLNELSILILENENKLNIFQSELQSLNNEKIIISNKIHNITEISPIIPDLNEIKLKFKTKSKEKEIVQNKINNFINELESPIFINWKNDISLIQTLTLKKNEENNLLTLINELDNHEYDPKCKFCIKHPIVKQKEEKINQLKIIQSEISNLKSIIKTVDPIETEKSYNDIEFKLNDKKNKLQILDNLLLKMEIEIEKISILQEKINEINKKKQENELNNQKIELISKQISEKILEIKEIEKNIKSLKKEKENTQSLYQSNENELQNILKQKEIINEIIEINSKNEIIQKENDKIDEIRNKIEQIEDDFNTSEIYEKYQKLQEEIQNETKIQLDISKNEIKLQQLIYEEINIQKSIKEFQKILDEIKNSKESLEFNLKIRKNIEIFENRIEKNELLISKFNEKLGVLYQQQHNLSIENKNFISQLEELKNKRSEFKLMQILEQSMGKDGLPLVILENYLNPITQSINNIISPFISRKINLHIDNDDLILDSYPDNLEKSVYIHGGMESFILDIAFKITLSNFAKLPKCDILFLDEGISAFDSERLSNIDYLFNFIKRYFSKTILITHIESVKENINEKIGIIKENNLSKIICEYSS